MKCIKDWGTLFLFALGNERTLVTCKSCEVQSASQGFTCDQCPFISQCKRKKCTSILIFMLKRWKNHKKSKKSMSIFSSCDQCLSMENVCHNFLMLHCRRMPWECKCFKMNYILNGNVNLLLRVKIWIFSCEEKSKTENNFYYTPRKRSLGSI